MRIRTRLSALALLLVFPALVSAQPIPTPVPRQFTQDLALGSTGAEVSFLQEVLCQTADFFPDCVINGTYGPETQNAVIRFQYHVGIQSPDGVVDAMTRSWLNALIEAGNATDFNAPLTDALTAYRNLPDAAHLATLTAVLQDRAETMRRLFRVNEVKAREFLFPKKLRNRVPRLLRSLIEVDRTRAKGMVLDQIAEYAGPPDALARYKYIHTKKGQVVIPNQDARLPAGARVYARGILLDDMLLPGMSIKDTRVYGFAPETRSAPRTLTSVLHLYAILLDFPDLPANQTRQAVFNAMNVIPPFYQTSSGGQSSVDLHVSAQWYHSAKTFDSLKCDYVGMFNEALALADAEFNYTQATTVMFIYPGFAPTQPADSCFGQAAIFPAFTCPHGGAGGAIGIQSNYPTPDGLTTIGVATVTDGIVCETRKPRTQIHEFTHTVGPGGFDHPGFLVCSQHSWENNAAAAHCTNRDDPLDVMGNGNTNDFGPITKELFGWLDSNSERLVTTPGTYTLGVYERATAANRVLRLPGADGTGRNFYVTYRQAEGLDAPPQGTTDEFKGALIYSSPPVFPPNDVHSYLLSAVPNPTNINQLAFQLNQTLYDPVTQWAITPVARTADNLTVAVDKLLPFSCTASASKVATGASVTFTAKGAGQPVTWSAPDATPSTGTGSTFIASFAQPGTYSVTYSFRGSSGAILSALCVVKVVSPPVVSLTMAEGNDRVTISEGESINLDWSSSGDPTICKLDGLAATFAPPSFFNTNVSFQGSMLVGPVTQPWNFRLSCSNAVGVTSDYATLNTTSPPTDPTPEGNNAQCLSIETSISPFTEPGHQPGDTVHVRVVMRNTGTTMWNADATPHRLILDDSGTATWSATEVPLQSSVAPGDSIDLNFATQLQSLPPGASAEPFTWRMAENGVPFGQACVTRIIMVSTTPVPVAAPDCSGQFVIWDFNGDFTNSGRGGSAEDLTGVGSPTFDTVNKQEGSAALKLVESASSYGMATCPFSSCTLANPSGPPFSAGCRMRPKSSPSTSTVALDTMNLGQSRPDGTSFRGGFTIDTTTFGDNTLWVNLRGDGATDSRHGMNVNSVGHMKLGEFSGVAFTFNGTSLTPYLNGHADGYTEWAAYPNWVPYAPSEAPNLYVGTFGNGQVDECWIDPDGALTAAQQAWVWRCGAKGEFCACASTDPTVYEPCATNADCGGTAICTQGSCSGLDYGTCLDGTHTNDVCRVASQSADCGSGHQCALATLPPCNAGGCF
jgi:peptidoglycan hydrolase-like protein with peptidoglycan-binding domain